MNLVNESFVPYLNEDILAEEYLNEGFDLNSIKNVSKRAAIITSILLASMSISGEKKETLKQQLIHSSLVLNVAKQVVITKDDLNRTFKKLINNNFVKNLLINPSALKDPLTLTTSHSGKTFIKHHEKLRLTAYEIGDGKISIGWGHAEPDSTSQFKVGDKISRKQAELIFNKDLTIAENGVKRLFTKWNNEGYDIKITQHMYDAMVSMAFNMGVGGLRGTELVQALKQEDYYKAGDLILQARVSKNFPGLKDRREKERELFLKGI